MWRELSTELPSSSGSVAAAAANAAAALAHGCTLPPGTVASVQAEVPSLLSLQVHLPPYIHSASISPAPVTHSSAGAATTHRLPMACSCDPAAAQGSCEFALSSPPSAADERQLASFTGQLGCALARARCHMAKQQLEVSWQGGIGPHRMRAA